MHSLVLWGHTCTDDSGGVHASSQAVGTPGDSAALTNITDDSDEAWPAFTVPVKLFTVMRLQLLQSYKIDMAEGCHMQQI